MKSKKNIYLLIPVVFFIWGVIGYKIYVTLNPEDNIELKQNNVVNFKPVKIKEVEKFMISANYRDPFLGKLATKKTPKLVSKKKVPVVQFPQILYKGMIAPKGLNQKEVFFVTINNTQQFLSVGKQIDGVQLLKGSDKQITISFQNLKKIIPIQQ